MKRRESKYRSQVAEMAKQVCQGKLNFFVFLKEISGAKNVYETGDDQVDELIDLLEHMPAKNGFGGVGEKEHQKYMQEIYTLIAQLEN